MKYIIIKDRGLEQAVVFTEILDHNKVAGNLNVVSAGFCQLYSADVDLPRMVCSAYGESVTLKIKSRPEDAEIILNSLTFTI